MQICQTPSRCDPHNNSQKELREGLNWRWQEYKKQADELKTNKEAIEVMKISHAYEIKKQEQEYDKKHKALLTEKLKSEDSLRKKAEREKKALN